VPETYRGQVDVRSFGTGERIVFLPYTREVFAATQEWVQGRHLFPELPGSPVSYDEAALA
jgi:hypothetical protein